jgi:hypothetical protein
VRLGATLRCTAWCRQAWQNICALERLTAAQPSTCSCYHVAPCRAVPVHGTYVASCQDLATPGAKRSAQVVPKLPGASLMDTPQALTRHCCRYEGSQTRPKKRHASVAQTCSHELPQKLTTCTGMFAQVIFSRHFLFYPGRYPVCRYLWAVTLYPLSHHKQKHLVYGITCNKPLLHIPGRGAV